MHADQVDTSPALVRRLLTDQFPQWAELPIEPVSSYGTDHDIYRLGAELSVRMPRREWVTDQAAKEAVWLPRLAPHLPLAIPEQVAVGAPAEGFPFAWTVYTWLPGSPASGGGLRDLSEAAVDLAAFILALRKVSTVGAHPRPFERRGAPLIECDEHVRRSIPRLDPSIDRAVVLSLWEESLRAPAWSEAEVWVHGDLLPGNLLVADGRLSAVIDFGALNAGDPACDLQPAWNIFTGPSRERFRTELAADDASWLRGRGWALYQAVTALAYYRRDTNAGIVRQASHALTEILADS